MSNIEHASKQLNKIDIRIREAIKLYSREENSVSLIGAAKQQSAGLIREFHSSGLSNIGENYLNEALQKRQELSDLDINWHFIGRVQSNKAKLLAQNFDLIHGVEKPRHAQKLANHVLPGQTLSILIQLNLDEEASKGGVTASTIHQVCAEICQIDNIRLEGFMLIPPPQTDFDEQRRPFARARTLLDKCNQQLGIQMRTLSMGMSNDLEAAISEGSTMVRIGTDLFGARK